MENLFLALGLIGAACCVGMFWAIEQGRVDGSSRLYYVVNGIGGFLILISALHEYDGGDAGTVVTEAAWVVVSLMGIYKTMRPKKGKTNA